MSAWLTQWIRGADCELLILAAVAPALEKQKQRARRLASVQKPH